MAHLASLSPPAARSRGDCLWLLSVALFLPVIALYAAHLIPGPSGVSGTGFLQYDQPYYMAIARKYFDDGGLSLTYGLPFSPDPSTPRVYFQPLTFALGLFEYVSGADPGFIYVLAAIVMGILCCRAAIELYREVVGLDGTARRIGLVCFVWGGGLAVLAALAHGAMAGEAVAEHLFDFDDTANGWWLPNLGRNLVIPTEALYHLVFFASVVLVLRRYFAGAVLGVLMLAVSHPFSGLQIIAVLGAWAVVERLIRSADRPPIWFAPALFMIGIIHVGYYLIFLPYVSPEHAALQQQWTLPWTFHYWNFLASDGLACGLAVMAVASRWRTAGSDWRQRLLFFWFAISLALANHDLLVRPVQPLHFTRGYIWIPLFLLGAPVLVEALETVLRTRTRRLWVVALALFVLLFDNAAWIGTRMAGATFFGVHGEEISLDPREREVFVELSSSELRRHLLISQDEKIGYLATVYTPLRSWYSHMFNTPYAANRRAELSSFFERGNEPAPWRLRPLAVVLTRTGGEALHDRLLRRGFHDRFANDRFFLLARDAGDVTATVAR
jgi:hypothetical protein